MGRKTGSGKRWSPAVAQKIYEDQGELTEAEMVDLAKESLHNRKVFFVNIYGYSAGKVAEAVYNAWEINRAKRSN